MFDASDPRASMNWAKPAGVKGDKPITYFTGPSYAKWYEEPPAEDSANGKIWYARAQAFMLVYWEAKAGATFERKGQKDEYVILLHDKGCEAEVTTKDGTKTMPGFHVAFAPPGDSKIKVTKPGRIVLMFTTENNPDMAAKSSNNDDYRKPHSHVPALAPWPTPPDGFKLRMYSLDVPPTPGRFGRIFRCTNFMVNYIDVRVGARDTTKMSPHHHDDFEQVSLALEGIYLHHLRWPWVTNKAAWRQDEHEICRAPSMYVIPPPSIHTSECLDSGDNQLVDLFCPPRVDFSQKPGWVLNEKDYPNPDLPKA